MFRLISTISLSLGLVATALAFNPNVNSNLAVYWGQNSYGQANPGNPGSWQKNISSYCQDDAIDIIPIGFVVYFDGIGGAPEINLANICSDSGDPVFPGTDLANCQWMASQIEFCQQQGKLVYISLGGASGAALTSDADGAAFANTVWNLFLGGSSSIRPFGNAVLDGVDLDIEGGGPTGWNSFATTLLGHYSGASKKYYLSAAPQCPFPDANLGTVLNAVPFDQVFVQFYNNGCGNSNYPNGYNFNQWDSWAKSSHNPNVKVYIGALASSTAGNGGYVAASTLISIFQSVRTQYSSFGGVMLWDASQAYANGRFDVTIKNALLSGGSTVTTIKTTTTTTTPTTTKTTTPTTTPTTVKTTTTTTKTTSSPATTTTPPSGGSCTGVAAWTTGVAYTAGQRVVYNGQLWQANYWTEGDPPTQGFGDWTLIGNCSSSKRNVPDAFRV